MNCRVDLPWQSTNKRRLKTVMFSHITGLLEIWRFAARNRPTLLRSLAQATCRQQILVQISVGVVYFWTAAIGCRLFVQRRGNRHGAASRRSIRFSDMLFAISDEFPLAWNSLFNLPPYTIDQCLVFSESTRHTLCFEDVGPVHELEV
jgi:hypothetical protein